MDINELRNQALRYYSINAEIPKKVEEALRNIPAVQKIYRSDANFLLVKVTNAHEIYNYLVTEGIVVRDRSKVVLCDGCLRMTIGTEKENEILIEALKLYK